MPSFRTIVMAYREFGIAIPYASTDSKPLVFRKGKQGHQTSGLQMSLPLTIEAPEGEINVVITRKSPQRVRLQLKALKIR